MSISEQHIIRYVDRGTNMISIHEPESRCFAPAVAKLYWTTVALLTSTCVRTGQFKLFACAYALAMGITCSKMQAEMFIIWNLLAWPSF